MEHENCFREAANAIFNYTRIKKLVEEEKLAHSDYLQDALDDYILKVSNLVEYRWKNNKSDENV